MLIKIVPGGVAVANGRGERMGRAKNRAGMYPNGTRKRRAGQPHEGAEVVPREEMLMPALDYARDMAANTRRGDAGYQAADRLAHDA